MDEEEFERLMSSVVHSTYPWRAFAHGIETDMERGAFVDPRSAQITFADYSQRWLELRRLRPRSTELYAGLLKNHLCPTFGVMPLARITSSTVRAWNAAMRAAAPRARRSPRRRTSCCARSLLPLARTSASRATHAC